MRVAIWESHFKRDFKKAQKQGKNLQKLHEVILTLQQDKPLPQKNRNHKLKGEYAGCWECHVEPDWLLIYKLIPGKLALARLGSHSELF